MKKLKRDKVILANEKDDRERRALGLAPRNPHPNKKHSVKKV